jgi:hypothetical protein
MPRKRSQKERGRPCKHGNTKAGVGQWRKDGHKRSKGLGRVSEIGKDEAEAMMAVILKRTNEDAGQMQKSMYEFGAYLEDVYMPTCHRKWK